MKTFRELLAERKFLISDGAWGTEMAKDGLKPGDCPELWNRKEPEKIVTLARSYVKAGSDIILTNTFGGTRYKLAKSGLEAEVEALNRRGAELSRTAAGDDALVFASLGPTGDFIAPLGVLTEDEVVSAYEEQIRALIAGGCEGIVLETMSDLAEVKCAILAARNVCDLPVIASLTYSKGERGFATMMGITPERAAAEIEAAGADAIGTNCGTGIEDMLEIVKTYTANTSLPIWMKPNAGLPVYENGKTVFKQSMADMVKLVPAAIEAGVRIIGGCCGTTPELIRLIAEYRDSL